MISSSLIAILGESDAEAMGQAVGSIFIPALIILWGISKSYTISLRPTTNRKCAFALIFALSTLLLTLFLGAFFKFFRGSSALPVINGLLVLVTLVCAVTTLVLGILGLSEYAKQKGLYNQGRAQAGWSLAISILLLLAFGMGFVRGLSHAAKAGGITKMSGTPGKILDFADLNFQFCSPGRPWVPVDLSKISKDSKVSFMRPRPDVYLTIIPEALGGGTKIDTEQLVAINQAHMESVSSSTRLIDRHPMSINGLDGILVLRSAELQGYQFFYLQWFLATNGYAYQLIGYCKMSERQNAEGELRQILSGFSLIDPHRIAASQGSGFTTNYVSPSHFYSVEVANTLWHAFASLKTDLPVAEFGASQDDSCFAVVPVWLGNQQLEPDARSSALLSLFNIKYPDDDLTHLVKINENESTGLQCDFQRTVDGRLFRYRIRMIQQGEFAYLTVAWTDRRPEDADVILNDALARIKITAPTTITLKSQLKFTAQDIANQGDVLNQAGLYHYKANEFEKALPLFQAAVASGSKNEVFINNVLLTFSQLNRHKEGLDYLETLAESLRKKPKIRVFEAYFQSKCSLTAEAITNYSTAFTDGYRDEEDFKDYVDLLISTGQYSRALKEVEQYLVSGDSTSVRLMTAQIYRAIPDYDKAIEFLKAEHNKALYNSKVTRLLIRTLLDAGKPNEALALCQELLKDDSQSYAAYYLKSQCEIDLKWYREAKTSLEAAAKLEPANEDVKSSLDYVSGLLGEGSNSMLKTPIDPVGLPSALTNWPSLAVPKAYATGYGCYYQHAIKALSYKTHTEYKITDYLMIDVLDANGVAAFSTYQLSFDPLSEDVFVNEAQVLDVSGKTLTVVKPSACYVIDDSNANKASQKKILNIPIAGLQPGCRISLVITRRSAGQLKEFPFLSHSLSKSYPVLGSGVFLQGDGSGLKIRTTSEIKRETFKEGIFLSLTNPLLARWEPLQPPGSSFLPMVWISDAGWPWSRLATNYLAAINDRLQPDENVRLKAQQLTGDLHDTDAKTAVLSRYVQTNCTYKAIEFGRRSRIPNKAVDTIHNSYGDCKDHAVLLQQLLVCAGIPANLALISSSGSIQADMPSLDQFNHMIVQIPNSAGERFIDCTDKGADLAGGVPIGLAEHQALILNATNAHLSTLPSYPPNASRLEISQKVSLLGDTDIAVDETINLMGIHGASMREYLQNISPADRQGAIQRDMGINDADITSFELSSLDAPSRPLQIKYSFILKKQFHQTPNGLVGRLRAGLERYYLTETTVSRRLTPFQSIVPFNINSQIQFNPPKGYRIVEKPDDVANIKSRFFTLETSRQNENGKLNLTFQYLRPVGQYSANDYSSYQGIAAQILTAMDPEVVLEKTGG